MACNRPELADYMTNFTGLDPVNAVVCPFAQSSGAGLGLGVPMVTLLVLGPLGLALTVRSQNPAPLIVAGILSMAVIGASIPGQAGQVAAIVLLFTIIAIGFILYRRTKTAL